MIKALEVSFAGPSERARSIAMFKYSRRIGPGLSDVREAIRRHHLATTFGWQDVAQRYRRSKIGAFWLTINMGIFIAVLSVVFSALFRQSLPNFLPFVAVGIIIWGLIASSLTDGCAAFVDAKEIILQVRQPFFVHIMRALWRNAIIFAHNMLIYPALLLIFGRPLHYMAFYALPGMLLLMANLLWMMLFLAMACTRFRDLNQIVQSALQALFYATPIVWHPDLLPDGAIRTALYINPFYHLMAVVRAPLLGEKIEPWSWLVVVALAVAGWSIALLVLARYKPRIPYWL